MGNILKTTEELKREIKRLDYRENLIVDQDNPILVQKAWRDRFSHPSHWNAGYGGKAYLSSDRSEDALTWNVFRSLQKAGLPGLETIGEIFQVSSLESVLFWGCDVELQSESQQILNCLIRAIDGKHMGTMTEPDLVILTDREVAFVECKLNANGKQSPWKAQGLGAEKRFNTYVEECGFEKLQNVDTWGQVYQLIRQYIYARSMAAVMDRRPLVFSLVREERPGSWNAFYQPLRDFDQAVFKPLVTWEDVRKSVARRVESFPDTGQKIIVAIDEALRPRQKSASKIDFSTLSSSV